MEKMSRTSVTMQCTRFMNGQKTTWINIPGRLQVSKNFKEHIIPSFLTVAGYCGRLRALYKCPNNRSVWVSPKYYHNHFFIWSCDMLDEEYLSFFWAGVQLWYKLYRIIDIVSHFMRLKFVVKTVVRMQE